jgi:hypothetical protein
MLVQRIFAALLTALFMAISSTAARAQAGEATKGVEQTGAPQEVMATDGCGLPCTLERAKEAQIKAFAGSWEGILTPEEGGPPPFRILFTFGADGTVVASDAGPPTPHLASAEHGAWERTGDNEFTIIYKQLLFDSFGNLDSLFKGRVKFKLDPARMEISGPVKVDFYDPAGNLFLRRGRDGEMHQDPGRAAGLSGRSPETFCESPGSNEFIRYYQEPASHCGQALQSLGKDLTDTVATRKEHTLVTQASGGSLSEDELKSIIADLRSSPPRPPSLAEAGSARSQSGSNS